MSDSVQHQLADKWTLFADVKFQNMKEVSTFDTIETFWQTENNIPKPSELRHQANYRYFRNNIKPVVEDRNNINGGCWTISLPDKSILDKAFLEIMLAIIGNTLTEDGDINGFILMVRYRCNRIAVWTEHGNSDKKQQQLGAALRNLVNFTEADIIFKKHQHTIEKNGNFFEATTELKA